MLEHENGYMNTGPGALTEHRNLTLIKKMAIDTLTSIEYIIKYRSVTSARDKIHHIMFFQENVIKYPIDNNVILKRYVLLYQRTHNIDQPTLTSHYRPFLSINPRPLIQSIALSK